MNTSSDEPMETGATRVAKESPIIFILLRCILRHALPLLLYSSDTYSSYNYSSLSHFPTHATRHCRVTHRNRHHVTFGMGQAGRTSSSFTSGGGKKKSKRKDDISGIRNLKFNATQTLEELAFGKIKLSTFTER